MNDSPERSISHGTPIQRLVGLFGTPRKPSAVSVIFWTVVIAAQLGLILAYAMTRDADISMFHVYPFVWINLGFWAVWRTQIPDGSVRQRQISGAVTLGYVAILAVFGGMVRFDDPPEFIYGLRVVTDVPFGYGPAILYAEPTIQLTITPYMLIGYIALGYLLYVTILDSFNAAIGGIVGIFTCIGCSWPIFASLLTGAGGITGGIAASVYAQSHGLSTLAFVLTVLLLYLRPFNRT